MSAREHLEGQPLPDKPQPRSRIAKGCLSFVVTVVIGIAAMVAAFVIFVSCSYVSERNFWCDSGARPSLELAALSVLGVGVAVIILTNRVIWRSGTGVESSPHQQPGPGTGQTDSPTPETPPAKEQRMVALETFVADGRRIKKGRVLPSSDRVVSMRPELFQVVEDENDE